LTGTWEGSGALRDARSSEIHPASLWVAAYERPRTRRNARADAFAKQYEMTGENSYRYECATLEGFVQRVVVLAQKGYTFFLQGQVPEGKCPERLDAKFVSKFEAAQTRSQRYYRKSQGVANTQYLRVGRDWVLLATLGKLEALEKERLSSLSSTPIRVGGYSISLRRDGSEKRAGRHKLRVHVRIDQEDYLRLRDELVERALESSKQYLEARIWDSGFEPYGPVHGQLRIILGKVNARRKRAGLELLSDACVRIYRTLPKHFELPSGQTVGDGAKVGRSLVPASMVN